jgi:hypothetical protein
MTQNVLVESFQTSAKKNKAQKVSFMLSVCLLHSGSDGKRVGERKAKRGRGLG